MRMNAPLNSHQTFAGLCRQHHATVLVISYAALLALLMCAPHYRQLSALALSRICQQARGQIGARRRASRPLIRNPSHASDECDREGPMPKKTRREIILSAAVA